MAVGIPARFVLYVEGPRDRSILAAWAQRLLPQARSLFRGSVILGGRRPARAVTDFRDRENGARALCVLDRDGGEPSDGLDAEDETARGLAFFTWGRRHIESYLLVPSAIRRALRLRDDDHRVEQVLESELPASSDTRGWRELDAKRLLGRQGPLAQVLGRPLPLARIARATREPELHEDVHALFEHLRGATGVAEPVRVVGRRSFDRSK